MVIRILVILMSAVILSCGSGKKETGPSDLNSGGIHMLSHRNTNIYLISGNDQHLLVDAGYEGSFDRIIEFLDDHGVEENDLDYLVVTHAHVDHAGAARQLKEVYSCKIIAGKQDSTYFVNGINAAICPTSLTSRIFSWFTSDRYPPVDPDIWIGPSDTLRLRGLSLDIYNVPGHTPGSLILRKGAFAFVGDLIRGRPLDHDRPARHYFMCDLDDNDGDIRQLLEDPSITIWYPGHFGPLKASDVRSWSDH